MICYYNNDGRLIATTDAFNNRIELTHNISDRTEAVTDRMGNTTLHAYDTRGNITSTTDNHGNTSYITYDDNNNELTTTDPLGNTSIYTYDSTDNLTSVTDALGNTSTYTYDRYGNQLTSIDSLGNTSTNVYDATGNLLSTTNALGQTTTMGYDGNGNLTATYDALGNLTASYNYDASGNMASTTDANNITRTFTYDNNGNQLTTTQIVDGETITSITNYNAAGQVTETIDPEGNTTSTLYNKIGKPYQTTDKLGNITRTTYDDRGNVIKTEYPDGTISRSAYDAKGRAYISQDRHDPDDTTAVINGSHTIYNSIGQVVRTERLKNVEITTSTVNGITEYGYTATDTISFTLTEYDRAGRVIKSTAANGAVSRTEYDNAGRTLAVIDTFGNRTSYTYNAAGQQTMVTDALGRQTKYEYDALGRRVRTSFADGTFTAVEYNTLGQKIKETDQAGLSNEFEYDIQGRLVKVTKPPVDNGSGTLVSPVYSYTYDNYGRQIEITDPLNRKTTFTYDKYGRQLTRTLPMGQSESQAYNNLGQLISKTDFNGQKTKFVYDNYGRPVENFFFNTGETVAAESVELKYDHLGRQSKIIKKIAGTTTRTTEYVYNDFGQLSQLVSPEGTINYTYNWKTGQKINISTNNTSTGYDYDDLGRLQTVTLNKRNGQPLSAPEVTAYNYSVVGLRSSVTLPNGVKTEYVYNDLNRLTNLTHKNISGDILSSYSYTLAKNGKRKGIHEERLESDNSYSATDISYKYDGLSRLVSESSNSTVSDLNFSNQYTYDLTGNRLKKSSLGVSPENIDYTYNDNDQLITETSNTKGGLTYDYDANGSLISKIGQDSSYTYTYNLQNRLATANIQRTENGSSVSIQSNYVYNQSGIRVRANNTVNSITQNRIFLLDAGLTGYSQVLEEFDAIGGVPVISYTLGDNVISQASIQNSSLITHHFLYDGHGSTRLLTDNTGTVTDTYDYDAYGIQLGPTSNITNRATTDLLYSGEQFDNELQMQYLRARYYDQNNGAFNRLDPYKGVHSNPQSLHKYTYAHCDPINGSDPAGLALYAFDGTGNHPTQVHDGVISPTNIYLMAYYGYDKQPPEYVAGVGNDAEYNKWWNPLNSLGKTFGTGSQGKIARMYKLLIYNYNAGDHVIDIIGFSRGAIMAAIFVNLIATYGIPKTAKYAEVTSLSLNKNIDAYSAPTIRFLGLFDPVAGPSGMRAPASIPSNVQKTAIAYARDEKRKAFKQSFFSGSNIITKTFPGCHSDVGGGYKQSGLSYNAMRWMVKQGGAPFKMPSMGNYRMTSETVRHQETQWYWGVTDIILSPFL